jgi:hypothetical protein
MQKFIRNNKKLTPPLIMPAALRGFIGWEIAAPIRGRIAAQVDLMRGRCEILSVGLPPPGALAPLALVATSLRLRGE